MLKISDRIDILQDSPIRKLVPFAEKAKESGVEVFHLNIGQPDIHTPDEFWDAIHKFDQKVLKYSKSQGIDSYRKKLVKYYGQFDMDVDDSEIIVTVGGSEALLFAMLTTSNAGDEIIIPEPFYANYSAFAAEAGIKIIPITTTIEDSFALPSAKEFEKVITPKTKSILICNPSNPTGKLYSKEELLELAKIAKKHNLFIISDEVYKEIVFDDSVFTSILSIDSLKDNAIVIDSVSKKYSACGARLGAMLSKNKDVIEGAMKLARARLAPPTLDQVGAEAMVDVNDYYISYIRTEYEGRRDVLLKGLSEMKDVKYTNVNGAMYAMVELPVSNSEHFCKWMLTDFQHENQTVMFAPAAGFYATPNAGNNQIRIAFVLAKPKLARAVELLKLGLKQYIEEVEMKQ